MICCCFCILFKKHKFIFRLGSGVFVLLNILFYFFLGFLFLHVLFLFYNCLLEHGSAKVYFQAAHLAALVTLSLLLSPLLLASLKLCLSWRLLRLLLRCAAAASVIAVCLRCLYVCVCGCECVCIFFAFLIFLVFFIRSL